MDKSRVDMMCSSADASGYFCNGLQGVSEATRIKAGDFAVGGVAFGQETRASGALNR
jgi:hypothetical protein